MSETYITSKDAIIAVTLYTLNTASNPPTVTAITWPTDIKSWFSYEGGDPEADQTQMIPGNLMPAVATPGPIKRSPVVVMVPYSVAVDALRSQIEAAVNQRMSASFQPKDADGNINGQLTQRGGLLRKPEFPKWKADSGEPAYLTLTMTCDT